VFRGGVIMSNIKSIIENIKKYNHFHEVEIKEFALPKEGWADQIANALKKQMKTTQLRKVFNSIKLLEQKNRDKKAEDEFDDPKLYMILPYLAYAKGRKFIPPDFYELIKVIIQEKIETVGDFRRFCEFMTAIVAYHKQYSK